MNDAATTLDRLVAKAGQLHSLPAVAIEVLRLATVASLSKNFLPQDLLDGADRCLYGSRSPAAAW